MEYLRLMYQCGQCIGIYKENYSIIYQIKTNGKLTEFHRESTELKQGPNVGKFFDIRGVFAFVTHQQLHLKPRNEKTVPASVGR